MTLKKKKNYIKDKMDKKKIIIKIIIIIIIIIEIINFTASIIIQY